MAARARAAIVLATLAAVAGCASDGNQTPVVAHGGTDAGSHAGSDGASDAGVDAAPTSAVISGRVAALDDFIDRLARAMCAWEFHCCTLPEIDQIGLSNYLTENGCQASTQASLESWFVLDRASIRENRLVLDPVNAAACIASFASGVCSPATNTRPGGPWDLLSRCPDPFVGRISTGERCSLGDECAPGSRCAYGGESPNNGLPTTTGGVSAPQTIQSLSSFEGACLAYLEEGQACDTTSDCLPGLYCRNTDGVCARPAQEGEPCNVTINQGNPIVVLPCDDTAKPVVCASGICGRLPRAGEPCLQDGFHLPCDPDPALALTCVGIEIDNIGICEPPGQLGDTCAVSPDRVGSGINDALKPCGTGLTCVLDADAGSEFGSCLPAFGLGEPCPSGQGCLPPAVCDQARLICKMPGMKHAGESCKDALDCASRSCGTSDGTAVCTQLLSNNVLCAGSAGLPQ